MTMNIEQLKEYYEEHKSSLDGYGTRKPEHREFVKSLKQQFSFIENMKGSRKTVSLYIHSLVNGITEPPPCVICNSPVVGCTLYEFNKTCSKKCTGILVRETSKNTNLKRYGVDNPMKNKSVREKATNTCRERYGVDNPMKSDVLSEKQKRTCIDKFGADSFMKTEEFRSKAKKTNNEKYGVDNPMQSQTVRDKQKATFVERYGVEHHSKTDDYKKKVKETNNERYGTDHYSKTGEYRERFIKTNMDRYGSAHPMKNDDIRTKYVRTNIERYGLSNPMKCGEIKDTLKTSVYVKYGVYNFSHYHISEESLEKLSDVEWMKTSYTTIGVKGMATELGVDRKTIYTHLHNHGIEIDPTSGMSGGETEVANFVESLNFDVVRSDRTILVGKELDIVVPEKRIAIEFNGLYWHSDRTKDRSYHLNKTKQAEAAGYRLIHIFEDEWYERKDQVKAKLKAILGVDDRPKVFARKTELKTPSKSQCKEFFDSNHIQGSTSYSIAFGLMYDDDFVAIMTFVKRSDGEYELNRYATSHKVPGGFSKLLKFAKRELLDIGVRKIVSFADRRYSVGGVYEKSGWNYEYDTPPDYQYVVGDSRVRKQNFRHDKLKRRFEGYDETLTERQNMEKLGFSRIYDCGLMKFSMALT